MRIFFIRFLAVCFLILGLWNIYLFFQEMITSNSANLAYIVIGIVVFRAGDNLFSLKEIGRKLTIGILAINTLLNIFTIYFALIQKNFAFTWAWPGLGATFHSDSVALFVAGGISWILIEVLFGLLLFQEKTRLIFQRK